MKTLRVRTKAGWQTKPAGQIPEYALSSGEIDDNFLAMEDQIEQRVKEEDLSNSTIQTKGSGMVGYKNSTVYNALDSLEQRIDKYRTHITTSVVEETFHGIFDDFDFFNLTLTSPYCTITLETNPEYDNLGIVRQIFIKLKQGTGINRINWPTNIKWTYNREPVLSYDVGFSDIITLTTLDDGQTWLGSYDGGWFE